MFRASKHDAAIFSLALPAVLALAADPLLSMVDTVFVGQVGCPFLHLYICLLHPLWSRSAAGSVLSRTNMPCHC
jgi:Na+-driven multidrug efflux pump